MKVVTIDEPNPLTAALRKLDGRCYRIARSKNLVRTDLILACWHVDRYTAHTATMIVAHEQDWFLFCIANGIMSSEEVSLNDISFTVETG